MAGTVSSPFGVRHGRPHHGIDIAATAGAVVVAARTGRVRQARWWGGYGRCVELAHGGGWTTRYAHLSAWSVHPGQLVRQGQVLGRVGSTGRSTGPHVHFEIRHEGHALDPMRLVR